MPSTDAPIHYVVPSVLGLISGGIGSLIAPWVHWGIERERQRVQARRELIATAREAVGQHDDMHAFRDTVIFGRLRQHLSAETLKFIEAPPNKIAIVMRGGVAGKINDYKPLVLRDISWLEQEWELL